MSQEFTQDAAKGGSGSTGSGATGAICTKSSLYKASDGKIEFVEYIGAGDTFPYFPGGSGTKKCTWTRLTIAADGGKASFTAVKVEAGTI